MSCVYGTRAFPIPQSIHSMGVSSPVVVVLYNYGSMALGHHRIVADALVLPYFLTGEWKPPFIGRSPAPHVDEAAQRVGSAEASF